MIPARPDKLASVLWSLALVVVCAGCGPDADTGPGSYQAVAQAQQNGQDTLTAQGAKLERKTYPPGDAWRVDLSGVTVSAETFDALQALDHVSELSFSGSNLADEHMSRVNELGTVLIELNISKTSVTDQGLAQLDVGMLRTLDVSGTEVTEEGVAQFMKKRADNPQVMIKDTVVKR